MGVDAVNSSNRYTRELLAGIFRSGMALVAAGMVAAYAHPPATAKYRHPT